MRVILAATLLPAIALAQLDRSTLSGTVTDPAGARIPAAMARVSGELLEIEATGNRTRAEAWFNRYDKMPPDLAEALKAAKDVPVDVEPAFSFPVME